MAADSSSAGSGSSSRVLAGGRLVTPAGVVDGGWVEVRGRRIVAVGAAPAPRPVERDLTGSWVVPGFVDCHVHGGAGRSYLSGNADDAVEAAAFHRAHGTTTTVASLVTADEATLTTTIASLADLVEDGVLAGIHLEGPFLSAAQCGAHDPSLLRDPEPALVEALLAAGPGAVRMVTLAPELPHGLEALRRVVDAGAVAAVGHTDCSYDEARAAIDAGATVATHLFNAMRPIHHRAPGPIPALLEDERVSVELVCDGAHLHPAVVRAAVAAAGPNRVCLVTDAITAAGMGDGDDILGGQAVRVVGGVARLVDGGSIAGSTLTMDRAFRFVVEAGASVESAVRMTATTPANVLGLSDRVGSLAAGLDADIVVLDDDLALQAVMTKGTWLP